MSPEKKYLHACLQLTALALSTTMVGCSLNPFADDDQPPPPVAQSAAAPSGSTSLDPVAASSQQSSYQPVLQEVSRPVPLAEGHPDEYTVQAGDTLWDIASTFLKDPWYWPEVWYINPQVENPHLIYPGDVLALVTIDGRDRVTTVRASTYRLSPQARTSPLTEAITSIPYEEIAGFLSKGLVLERSQIDQLPYIVAVRGDRMIAAAGNNVYVRGGASGPLGTRYSVVKIGNQLRDPDDGKLVGYQGVYIGEGSMARGGDPATVTLNETNREAEEGDKLIPETVDIPLNFFPKAPEIQVDGRIISVVDGVSLIGQYQVVVINRGARNGLAPGDVLAVYQAGAEIRDRYSGKSWYSSTSVFGGEKITLPDEEAGTMMVFKVYDRIAYGLIMEAVDAIRVMDAVRNPI